MRTTAFKMRHSLFLLCLLTVTGLKAQADFTYTQLAPNSCKPGTFVFTADPLSPDHGRHWFYGDGTELTVWGNNQTTHTYLHPGTYAVSLVTPKVGTNSYDTVTNVISFSSNNYAYSLFGYSSGVFADSCDRVDTGTFYNKSAGSGTLSYRWQFSDGTVSTAPGLTYVLLPQVTTTVQFVTTASTGCSDTATNSYMAFNGRKWTLVPTAPGKAMSANFECPDSYGWTNYYYDPGTPFNSSDDTLLLSIKKNGNNIGEVGDGTFSLTTSTTPGAGSNTGIRLTNPLIDNPSGFWVMNRYWDLHPTTQPVSPVNVRFYFNSQDLNDVNGSYPSHNLNYTDLIFYKTVGGNPDPSTNLAGAQRVISLVNSTIADTTHWVYEKLELDRHAAEFQVASFSGGGGGATGNGSALPLQLLSFTAVENQRQVTLSWSMAQELNIDKYELLVSSDGQYYTLLTTSKAGNMATENNYRYTYKENSLNKAFYKLRITDKSGNEIYSNVIPVVFISNQLYTIFPNPVRNIITVQNQADDAAHLQVTVYTNTGTRLLIKQVSMAGTKGKLDVSALPSGNYKLVIDNGKGHTEYKSFTLLK